MVDGLGDFQAVVALPDRFLIAARSGNVVELRTSPDGAQWTTIDTSLPRRSWISGVVATPSRYLAIGWSETSADVMWESMDLAAWEPVTLSCQGDTLADLIGVAGDTVLVAGRCDGVGTTWIITGDDAVAHPAPFGGGYEITHDGDAWYVLDGEGLWRSGDATAWTAVPLPSTTGNWTEWVDVATFGGSLLLAADDEGRRGYLWRRTADRWERVGGAFAAGESLYSSANLLSGPAGILVSWNVGYPPSAHAEQSPAVIVRNAWTVHLYRPGMPSAAEILDGDGDLVLSVDFPEPGAAPPDHVEIDEADATVRILHPDTAAVLVELTFDEIEEAIRLDRPQRHAWWSIDGASWTEVDPPPVGYLHSTVVGTSAVVAAERVTIRTLPPWVSRLVGELGEDVTYVWQWVPEQAS